MVRMKGGGIVHVRLRGEQCPQRRPRRGGHHRTTVPGGLKLAIVRTLQAAGHRLTGRQLVEALHRLGVVYAPASERLVAPRDAAVRGD